MRGLRRGTVTLAVIESASRGILPYVLAGFWVRHPEISVDVQLVGLQDAVDLVHQGGRIWSLRSTCACHAMHAD
ncbi:LysR substrate binding domain-containing protein [Roseicitreum antarcticum]|uniref:LysR substrate binding domain-containing protein n=2 Tax=Roseicitreum antarcticum TaxID=564137 RepID=A0A1H2ZNA2_9RHOB|nr:LysR substrate binding domain-containing protein [Roseicitreum antarcticum]